MSPSPLPDHYQVLGISQDASTPEIKAAFRKLARRLHPDVTGSLSPDAAAATKARYKDISYAYYVLSDPIARRQYDEVALLERLYEQPCSAGPVAPIQHAKFQDVLSSIKRPEDKLEVDWQRFISRPFDWAERAGQSWHKWEWTFSILSLTVLILLATRKLTFNDITTFVYSTASQPDMGSIYPTVGMVFGVMSAMVVAAVVTGHAVMTHRHSFKTNADFRSDVPERGFDLFSALGIFAAFGGIIAGHYLF